MPSGATGTKGTWFRGGSPPPMRQTGRADRSRCRGSPNRARGQARGGLNGLKEPLWAHAPNGGETSRSGRAEQEHSENAINRMSEGFPDFVAFKNPGRQTPPSSPDRAPGFGWGRRTPPRADQPTVASLREPLRIASGADRAAQPARGTWFRGGLLPPMRQSGRAHRSRCRGSLNRGWGRRGAD